MDKIERLEFKLTEPQASFLEVEVMGRGFLVEPDDPDEDERKLLRAAEAVEKGLVRRGRSWFLTLERPDFDAFAEALLHAINAVDEAIESGDRGVNRKTLDAMSNVHLEVCRAIRQG